MSRLQLMPLLLFGMLSNPNAQEPSKKISVETNSRLRPSMSLPMDRGLLAQQWGLQEEELERFRGLMEGPLGTYSPNLDPLSALGIEARTDAERQRYALLQVEAEARRVEKLLAYQRAYDQAWKDRYPAMTMINPPPMSSPMTIRAAGRKSVFVRYDCLECDQLIKQFHDTAVAFDLFLVGSGQDDNRLRQWVQRIGIQPLKIREGSITINHDNGRWVSIGAGGDLPAVMHQVNGKWLRL